jgi:hypothetical protein
MMLSKLRFARGIATEGHALSVYPREGVLASERRQQPLLSRIRIGKSCDLG